MAKTKISEWSSTPANNTDIDSINIAEGCAPSGINDALREMMAQVKDLYAGTSGDIIAVAAGGTGVGTSTGSGNNVLSTSPTLVTPALGTPSALVGTNITGTAANFNINGTVGATTANTGAFTTVTAAGEVLSTGSGAALAIARRDTSAKKWLLYSASGEFNIYNNAGGAIPLTIADAAANNTVSITSAGLAVTGTFSASGAITNTAGTANGVTYINGSKVLTSGSALTFSGSALRINDGSGGGYLRGPTGEMLIGEDASGLFVGVGYGVSPAIPFIYGSTGTTYQFWRAGGSEQMRLTSTGLGIGTSSPSTALDVASSNSGITLTNTAVSNKKWRLGGNASGYFVITESGVADRMFIDTSGNVGIGKTPTCRLDVTGSGATPVTFERSDGTYILSLKGTGTTSGGALGMATNDMVLLTNGSERARIDSSGNLLVGTTTANGKISLYGTTASTATSIDGTGRYKAFELYDSGVRKAYLNNDQTNTITSLNTAYGTLTFGTGDTERARFDSSGNLLVGGTSVVLSSKFLSSFSGATSNGGVFNETANTSNTTYLAFANGGTAIGSVTRVAATSAVVYNTTSDYRLKTVTGTVTGQGARIDALKPIDYLWKEGGQQARGFLAHEFQTVYPNSVTGEKDAVDADGNPKHQSMQAATSEVIADLVAEIQSLRQRLSAANL